MTLRGAVRWYSLSRMPSARSRRNVLIVFGLGAVDDAEAGQNGRNPGWLGEAHGRQEAAHEGFKRFAELPDARSIGGIDVGEDAQHAAPLGGIPVARVDVQRLCAVARKRPIGDPFAVQRSPDSWGTIE